MDNLYYLSCGLNGNTHCFRMKNSKWNQEDIYTCDIHKAEIFSPEEAAWWNNKRTSKGLKLDKPIPAKIVCENSRLTFCSDDGVLAETKRLELIKFWKSKGFV